MGVDEMIAVQPLVLSFSTSPYGNPTTFGQFIRNARLEKELSQVDVAQPAERNNYCLDINSPSETTPQSSQSYCQMWCMGG